MGRCIFFRGGQLSVARAEQTRRLVLDFRRLPSGTLSVSPPLFPLHSLSVSPVTLYHIRLVSEQ